MSDFDHNHRNAILESAALVAEQIDDCRSSTYDSGCTDDGYRQAKNHIAEAIRALKKYPRFQETFCSQCGGSFGPGDSGYSHCRDHKVARVQS